MRIEKMTILHISSVTQANIGGVAIVVPRHVKYQSTIADTALLDINNTYRGMYEKVFPFSQYKRIECLPMPFCSPDLVIFHEVYKPEYIKLYKECIRKRIPYIVVPHGCLSKDAQKIKPFKKKLGNWLLFNSFLSNASAIQYLCEKEKEDSILSHQQKNIVAGNGFHNGIQNNPFSATKEEGLTLLYIGRYAIRHKGLDLLLSAISKIQDSARKNNIKLKMYGMGEDQKIKKKIKQLEIEDLVEVGRAVFGEEKEKILKEADVFIQTSRFEGLPLGILEAMCFGLPLIVTPGTGIAREVKEKKNGIVCSGDPDSIADAILKFYHKKDDLDMYSRASFSYAQKYLSWDNVTKHTLKQYEKVLNLIKKAGRP